MKNYKLVPIGKVADFINGFPFKPTDWSNEGLKIIRIQNLTDSTKPFNRTQIKVPTKYIVEKGDVLVSWSATIDVFIWDDEDALLNQHIFKVVFDEDKIVKDYFIHALKISINELTKFAHGSTMKHVVKKDFDNHKIPLPESKSDQIRIATVLSRAEALIAQRKESLRLLDDLLRGAFLDMFGDPVKNEKGWEKVRVDKCADVLTGFAFKSEDYVDDKNEIRLCGGLIILPDLIDWSKTNYWPKNKTNGLEKYWLEENDIVIALDRPWISSGFKIGLIKTEDLPALLVQRTARVRAFDIRQEYLFYAFKHKAFERHCKPTETTVPHISPTELKSYLIPKPPTELQNKFAALVEKVEQLRGEYTASLKELEQLYGSLTQRAFKGELDLDFEVAEEILSNENSEKEFLEESLSLDNQRDWEGMEAISKINKEIAQFHDSLTNSTAEKDIDNKLRQLDTELKIRGEIPYYVDYVKYRIMENIFSYEDFKKKITETPFEVSPSADQLHETILSCLESNPPFLKQVFDHYPPEKLKENESPKNPKMIHFIKTNAT